MTIKLELIQPACSDNAPLPSLSLASLAGLTPDDVTISFTDDFQKPIDLDSGLKPVDLVGITCTSKSVSRAYAIARAYADRNIPVVLGGVHPTARPEEAMQRADAVLAGEAEGVWPRLLADFKRGRLQPYYSRDSWADLAELPQARRSIYPDKSYLPMGLIQATRGCPHLCEFCSVRRFFGGTYRYRPVSDVLEEVRGLKQSTVLFVDDNIVGHAGYSRRLFQGMARLKKRWFGQASLAVLDDQELLDLMVKSGCKGLLLGVETVSNEGIRGARKYQNKPSGYKRTIENLQRKGIAVWGSFIFGLDQDGPDIFERCVRFAVDCKLYTAVFAVLTPYPGTPLFDRLEDENRLTDSSWWLAEQPEAGSPFFYPARMSRRELLEGWQWAWQEFYSYASIVKRFQWEYPFTVANKLVYFPYNLVQHRFVQKKILSGERLGWSKYPWSSPG
jgi:radical SAM superfamily enzyme YgiQ (UPF0313 family)